MFQATVKGSSPITISWLKDNDDIVEDENTKMTYVNNVATLMIRAIEVKHDGKYFCQAKNDAGIQRCSALLTVKGWFSPLAYLFQDFSHSRLQNSYVFLYLSQSQLPSLIKQYPSMSQKVTLPPCSVDSQEQKTLLQSGSKMGRNCLWDPNIKSVLLIQSLY